MTPAAATLLAEYNAWMNRRLYDAAATLPAGAVERDMGAFFGSLLQTLNHIAVGDTIWLRRFASTTGDTRLAGALQAYPAPTSLRQPLAASLPELRDHRDRLDALISDWAARLSVEQLAGPIDYTNMAGQPQRKNLGALVLHFFNHQTHHRGQATTLLFQLGVDVGTTDLLAVIPNEV